jgi:hypothetical protein
MHQALSIALCLLAISSPAHSDTALEMREYCKGVVEAPSAPGGMVEMPTTFQAGFCWGAFAATQAFAHTSAEGSTRGLLQLCIPQGVTRKQMVEVFYRDADLNPQLLHEEWHYVAWLALAEGFPCKSE